MSLDINKSAYKVVATARCGGCGCGCPTVLEGENADELVIVGAVSTTALADDAVKSYVGAGESVVIIPKSLLLDAAKKLS